MPSATQNWTVYILNCSDDTFYTGITTNIDQRLVEHNSSPKGAKYTRGRRPVTLLYKDSFPNRSEALKEEIRIKSLSRKEKEALAFGK